MDAGGSKQNDFSYTLVWLVVWNIFLFSHILGIIIPTDELILFRVGGLEHFLFSPIVGMMIQSD